MALDFLLDTTKGKLRENVEIAKKIFYQNFEHEIAAYKNTLMLSQVFSKEGLAGPSSLRELYRDISGNPQDPYVLFDKLSQNFTYDHLRKVVRYLLHSLGADLTSKGPSIERGELYKLFGEVRTLQAILGIYLFFRSRMKLLRSLFSKNELTLPATLNFETISKAFVELLKEKFISLERLKLQSKSLDLDEILEQIFIYTQMRDGIRNVSPRLYKTEKQKQELLRTIIEYLEDLDDQLEEEEEDKEKKKKKEEKDA
jgi:type III secretion protein W